MGNHERPPHSSSFGTVASAYAEHRPDYAPTAVRWALGAAPGPRVLDLGAGTGKLTGTLVALGAEVIAVEPDSAMLAELRRALPGVRALSGSAEAIPLPDGSVDAVLAGNALHWFDMAVAGDEIARVLAPEGVLAGNALHWFDMAVAGDEIARVLAPEGVLAGLWNVLDTRVDWVAGLERVGGRAVIGPRDTVATWRAATAGLYLPGTGRVTRFGAPEQAEFEHWQRRDADSLVETLATRAGVLVMADRERRDTLDRLRSYLASRTETASGEFELPMLTGVLRVREGYAMTE